MTELTKNLAPMDLSQCPVSSDIFLFFGWPRTEECGN